MALLHHLTMAEIISRILAALIFAGSAGGLTAAFSYLLGDRTPQYQNRLSFNPFSHVSLAGIFLAIAFRVTWFQSMPFDAKRKSFIPIAAVVLAMLAMIGLIPILDLLRSPLHSILPRTMGYGVLAVIENLQLMIGNSVALGLLPLPGLWLGAAIPAYWPKLSKFYRKNAGFGLCFAAILVILGWFPDFSALVRALKLV